MGIGLDLFMKNVENTLENSLRYKCMNLSENNANTMRETAERAGYFARVDYHNISESEITEENSYVLTVAKNSKDLKDINNLDREQILKHAEAALKNVPVYRDAHSNEQNAMDVRDILEIEGYHVRVDGPNSEYAIRHGVDFYSIVVAKNAEDLE